MLESLIDPLSAFGPDLIDLVKQCLHNAPQARPNCDELLAKLQDVKSKVGKENDALPLSLEDRENTGPTQELEAATEVTFISSWKAPLNVQTAILMRFRILRSREVLCCLLFQQKTW